MDRTLRRMLSLGLGVVLLVVLVGLMLAPDAVTKKPGGGSGCPRVGILCPDVWDPVICDDGETYSNACYAYVACATGCVPAGGGPVPAVKPGGGDDDGCPRVGWVCPTYWDPVICDDGKIYSNSCFAWVACATGCESLGQGPVQLVKK